MPIHLSVPLEKDYVLERTDEVYGVPDGEPTRITVRQATQGEHERRAALFSQIVREMAKNDAQDLVRLIQRFSFEELKRIEVQLTLKACNIVGPDDKLLFSFDAKGRINEQKFREAWDLLPPAVAMEIHEKVLDLNVDWRPNLGEED